MKTVLLLLAGLAAPAAACAQTLKANVPYVEGGHVRQVLDIYAPAQARSLPVVFWIHGGGWMGGDKGSVQEKPRWFADLGLVFVSTNYRLLPDVTMGGIAQDVAKALGWVHRHIAQHGGDPRRIFVMGHSAGAQIAALLCTDHRYLQAEGVPFSVLRGCVPVDGDTFDVPAIVESAETRFRAHGQPQPKLGYRQKFGDEPARLRDYSAVTHVAPGKGIPPFLILYMAEHPFTSSQAHRLSTVLQAAGVPVQAFGARDTTHTRLSYNLGQPNDPATKELAAFVARALKN